MSISRSLRVQAGKCQNRVTQGARQDPSCSNNLRFCKPQEVFAAGG